MPGEKLIYVIATIGVPEQGGTVRPLFITTIESNMSPSDRDALPEAEALRLDQFLKLNSIAQTGGQAKLLIQAGEVRVNGAVETRRRRKLIAGDVVEMGGEKWAVGGATAPQE
jgi:ribosome-associated protein